MHKQTYFIIMPHPLVDGCGMVFYAGGLGCQNNKFVVKEALFPRHLCMVVVMLDSYLRYLHSLILRMVDGSLLHNCNAIGR